jgi:signal transduction histidine kinase
VVRLNRIVSEVLDYAKPITFAWQDADPAAICREAAAAVTGADAGAAIAVDAAPGPATIRTDPERVRTVLVNVLQNAVQAVRGARAGEDGEAPGPLPVTLRLLPLDRGGAVIVVHDDGPGVDPGAASRLFEPFFTTRRGGTGLGLAIARNIVEGLGGSITISGGSPAGTDVRIELPPSPPRATDKAGA